MTASTTPVTGEVPPIVFCDGQLEVFRQERIIGRIRGFPYNLVAAGAALIVLTGGPTSNAGTDAIPIIRDVADDLSTSGWIADSTIAGSYTGKVRTLAQEVKDLHQVSGLTWEQLGRLFGVSRRAVHNWANGSRMTSRHAETLAELRRTIEALPATEASGRRDMFLAPGGDGRSQFERFRDYSTAGARIINDPPLSPGQLLGAPSQID